MMSRYYFFNTLTCMLTSLIISGLAFILAGYTWAIVFFVVGILVNFGIFFRASAILEQFFQPHMIAPQAAKELYVVLNDLANRAGIKLPILYVTKATRQPNMLALVAKDGNKIIISPTILKVLKGAELRAMLAYQVARISSGAARHQSYLACMALLPSFFLHLGHVFPSFGGSPDCKIPAWSSILTIPFTFLSHLICRVGNFRKHMFVVDIISLNISGNPQKFYDGLRKLEVACNKIPEKKQQLFPSLGLLCNVSSLASGGGLLTGYLPSVVERIEKINTEIRNISDGERKNSSEKAEARTKKGRGRKVPSGKVKRPGITDGPSRSRGR